MGALPPEQCAEHTWGCGDSLVSKLYVVQAWGPESTWILSIHVKRQAWHHMPVILAPGGRDIGPYGVAGHLVLISKHIVSKYKVEK